MRLLSHCDDSHIYISRAKYVETKNTNMANTHKEIKAKNLITHLIMLYIIYIHLLENRRVRLLLALIND